MLCHSPFSILIQSGVRRFLWLCHHASHMWAFSFCILGESASCLCIDLLTGSWTTWQVGCPNIEYVELIWSPSNHYLGAYIELSEGSPEYFPFCIMDPMTGTEVARFIGGDSMPLWSPVGDACLLRLLGAVLHSLPLWKLCRMPERTPGNDQSDILENGMQEDDSWSGSFSPCGKLYVHWPYYTKGSIKHWEIEAKAGQCVCHEVAGLDLMWGQMRLAWHPTLQQDLVYAAVHGAADGSIHVQLISGRHNCRLQYWMPHPADMGAACSPSTAPSLVERLDT